MAITPLPEAPAIVEGAINFRGSLIPVFNVRSRFGLPARPLTANEHLVIAEINGRPAGFRVDQALDFLDLPFTPLDPSFGEVKNVAGLAILPDGLIVIQNLDTFLSQSESTAVEEILKEISSSTSAGTSQEAS